MEEILLTLVHETPQKVRRGVRLSGTPSTVRFLELQKVLKALFGVPCSAQDVRLGNGSEEKILHCDVLKDFHDSPSLEELGIESGHELRLIPKPQEASSTGKHGQEGSKALDLEPPPSVTHRGGKAQREQINQTAGTVIVEGAGGDGKAVNGTYEAVGDYKSHPKFKQVGGQSIIYFNNSWKINDSDCHGGWYYSRKEDPEHPLQLPEGPWTTEGYSSGADPPPTVRRVVERRQEPPEAIRVSGAGGAGEACNGEYLQCGQHSERTKYQLKGGAAIMYYDKGVWRINGEDSTTGWFYEVNSDALYPPEGTWRTEAEGAKVEDMLLQKEYVCPKVVKGEKCTGGTECDFAHSRLQLGLCPRWLKDGTCDQPGGCGFLHTAQRIRDRDEGDDPVFGEEEPAQQAEEETPVQQVNAVNASWDRSSERWTFDGRKATNKGDGFSHLVSNETASSGILRWCLKYCPSKDCPMQVGLNSREKGLVHDCLRGIMKCGVMQKGHNTTIGLDKVKVELPVVDVQNKYLEVVANMDSEEVSFSVGDQLDQLVEVHRLPIPYKEVRLAITGGKEAAFELIEDSSPRLPFAAQEGEVLDATFDTDFCRKQDWRFENDVATSPMGPTMLLSRETATTGILRWCLHCLRDGNSSFQVGVIPASKAQDKEWLRQSESRGCGLSSSGTGSYGKPSASMHGKLVEVIADLVEQQATFRIGDSLDSLVETNRLPLTYGEPIKLACTGWAGSKFKLVQAYAEEQPDMPLTYQECSVGMKVRLLRGAREQGVPNSYIGQVGTIITARDDGDGLQLRFDDGESWWCSAGNTTREVPLRPTYRASRAGAPLHIADCKKGDKVRVLPKELAEPRTRAKGADWTPEKERRCGTVGEIVKVDRDETIKIKFDGGEKLYFAAEACCKEVSSTFRQWIPIKGGKDCKVGDKVRILPLELSKGPTEAKSNLSWNEEKTKRCGTVGTIARVDSDDTIRVKFNDEKEMWFACMSCAKQTATGPISASVTRTATLGRRAAVQGLPATPENLLKLLLMDFETQSKKVMEKRKERMAQKEKAVRLLPCTTRLKLMLGWSDEGVKNYVNFKARLDGTVGLEPAKDFIMRQLWDSAGKAVQKESRLPGRHILISGPFGAGKRTAALLIGDLHFLLGGCRSGGKVQVGATVRFKKSVTQPRRGWGSVKHGDVGKVNRLDSDGDIFIDFPSHPGRFVAHVSEMEAVVQGPEGGEESPKVEVLNSLSDIGPNASPKLVYFVRLTSALTDGDSAILDALLAVESIAILSGEPEVADASVQLPCFLRRRPERIVLCPFTAREVAHLIAEGVEQRGYCRVGEGDVGTAQLVNVLEHIVRQQFDDHLIRTRNGYLAEDLLALAISRKNDRMRDSALDSRGRWRLTPADFGLDVLTAEQQSRRLEQVDEDLRKLIGWGLPSTSAGPRHFFEMLRKQSTACTGSNQDAGSPAATLLQMPKALWVTGYVGTGRKTFVELAARFQRACGAISKEEVVLVDVAALLGMSKLEDHLATQLAIAGNGCLALLNVDLLAESENRTALRAIVNLFSGPGAHGLGLAVVIGSEAGMKRVGQLESSLEMLFPTQVVIPPFTASELVQLIQKAAKEMPTGSLQLEDGLESKLVTHIQSTYGEREGVDELGDNGTRGLAAKLLQKACQNRIARLFNFAQGEVQGDHENSSCLTAKDFEIGAALGESTKQKDAVDEKVSHLVGMKAAKDWFEQIKKKVAFVEQTGNRSDLRVCLNIIITGNPGTGKTSFARLLAEFFYTYGILPEDKFVEKNALELKAEHMGGTAPLVKRAVDEAKGGCLFLDEAYALIDSSATIGGGGDAFSQEALRTLLTEVENNRTGLMVVLAGYKEKMGKLMRAEEGLARRFPNRLHLDDYTPADLAEICERKATRDHERQFEAGLKEKLVTHIQNFYWRDIAQQNGGLAINLTERALDRQIVRLVAKYPHAFTMDPHKAEAPKTALLRHRSVGFQQVVRMEVATLTAADFGIEERPIMGDPEMRARVVEEVERLVGMNAVKVFFEQLARTVAFVERGGDPQVLRTSLNLQLLGNPGTGKTTVARLIGRYLYAHGILPRDIFVERNALAMKGQYVGQTAPTVMEAVRDAMGGCLFIDEAHSLVDKGGDRFSGEVIRTLLTEVENHRTGLLVVLAGYADKMEILMDSDPGLRRRFLKQLVLEDYSSEELALICENTALDRFDLEFAPGFSKQMLADHIRRKHSAEISQQNGGLAVALVEDAFRKLAERLGDPQGMAAISGGESRVLKPEDFGIGLPTSVKPLTFQPPARIQGAVSAMPATAAAPPPTPLLLRESLAAIATLVKALEVENSK